MKQKLRTLHIVTIIVWIVLFVLPVDRGSAYAEKTAAERPEISSETAALMDADTGQVLLDKQGAKRMYPASISKIATGITALEQGTPEEMVTVSRRAADTNGTSVYLVEGEKMPLKQLVQGLLINSGNDAATAIAEHLGRTENTFSQQMTEYLKKKTGIVNTSFTNPHGLFEKDHYTTAEDMARLTKYAMQNDDFRDIVSTKTLAWEGKGWETELRNHHQLLWEYKGTTGVKNGYVSEAGYTLVTTAKRQGRELIAVIMKADTSRNAYEDTVELLDYGFDAFDKQTIAEGTRFQSPDQSVYIASEEKKYLQKKGTNATLEAGNGGEWRILNERGRVTLTGTLTKERVKSGGEKKERAAVMPMEDNDIKRVLWNTWTNYTSMTARIMYYHFRLML
ncbi:D-alanyl-D-alanine carboxypeptidase family protein [Salibacterium halotolerans]|uniref:D-alanyl-D-alanine carboxypeptidase/D-alanyl-D-alanine carboxypeptidase (Penicillin-binding protein 5/6) n=1 Tax=Salibacterium halotolerans TaxID=1884432 RepID=A0A1I5SWL0_9BACI|nr:D-alanyl-D-alanine carboxypeptidase family protein [Salibacterium halotolerans]SFP75123.1 D-alanyl-D-alanine carboxypeptidase/D-alanyl-D-alanine carboxypeptidase (penicillin-binding protein 5/6) [Salibacterium halotolerans]